MIPLMLRQDLKVFSMIEVGFQQTLPGEIESPPLKGPGVGMHLSAPRRLVQQRNERTHEGLEVPSAVDVVPVGTLAYYRSDAASEDIGMLLDNSFFRRVAAEAGTDPDRIEIVPSLSVPDQQIERIGLSFLSEIETGGLGGELFTESLANMLALHLLRSHSSLGRRSRRRIGREGDISKRHLSKTTDYINDILPRKLTLAEIAGAARMSPHHFARSFKAETGLSPHQYVIQRRVERARALLADTDLTLAEVARAVGFANHSHLSSHIRRVLGVSPGA
ncbi:MAG: helix-turn-helix transcriptional regulator, partial [Rubrobacter sp.]|nr:helix-turn-helix transcriptional regulator [Rubrobacter sp.]